MILMFSCKIGAYKKTWLQHVFILNIRSCVAGSKLIAAIIITQKRNVNDKGLVKPENPFKKRGFKK